MHTVCEYHTATSLVETSLMCNNTSLGCAITFVVLLLDCAILRSTIPLKWPKIIL